MPGDAEGVPAKLYRWIAPFLRVPSLTRGRIAASFAIAVVVDAVQIASGPLGWGFVDEALDVVAMVVISWILGFHLLLLPTFVIEALPVADALPTWTGCVGLVVAHRRRQAGRP